MNPGDAEEEFVGQIASNQYRLLAFVVSLTPNWIDVEEIVQQTNFVLWNKRQLYDPSRDFLPWAFGIARLEVKKYLSKKNRRKEVLGEAAIDVIQSRFNEEASRIDERQVALKHCLEKLPGEKRTLVERCYSGCERIRDIAKCMGITADALSWRLRRIRTTLHECIDRTLASRD